MTTRARLRSVLYSAVTLLIALVVLEAGASWMMLVYYRASHQQNFATYDTSYLSVVNLARRLSRLAGLSEPDMVLEQSSPSPFFRADPVLGYSAAPGVYTHSYARRNAFGDWEYFRNKVTINPDGTRWVGAPRPGKPTVYIFGDSWVFGNGVPDELTFAARLHEALTDWNVRLVALGGWSLTQAWLNFERLKEIGPGDIVILGYADYFDVRHVQAPSRLLEIETWLNRINQPIPPFQLPKATLAPGGGGVTIGYIDQRCAVLGDYCRRPDPSHQEMTDVTAALVNRIANRSPAKVYLLHFAGSPDNPVRRKVGPKVQVVGALRSEFDSVVQDDIMGFDGHPGPFWHYAISRRLLETVAWHP